MPRVASRTVDDVRRALAPTDELGESPLWPAAALVAAAGLYADLPSQFIAGANRDPATFADPDRFDPDRPNARLQLAFASGPHVCIGMHVARLEALTAAERLFARLPNLRLDPGRPSAPRGLVFRKPPRVDVLWDA